MGRYDTQVICRNGHQITDRQSIEQRQLKYCTKCGAEGISRCPACNQPILGYYVAEGVFDLSGETAAIPSNCESCGVAYPWKGTLEAKQNKQFPPIERLNVLLTRFHSVARQLRARHDDRDTLSIADEYDVQDLLHALLRLSFDDIRPEEWTPSYAGKSSRMDFLLKPEGIVVEVKMTRKGLTDKQVGDQLIVDIARYQGHPNCKTLVCFVYDPDGYIRNPTGLCGDLQCSNSEIAVKVIVSPIAS